MIDNVFTLPSSVPEASAAPAAPEATAAPTQRSDPKVVTAAPQTAAPAATRLLVEPDGALGYVYRLVDAVTGRLLAEVPRERADDLKASPDYAAGALVSTSA